MQMHSSTDAYNSDWNEANVINKGNRACLKRKRCGSLALRTSTRYDSFSCSQIKKKLIQKGFFFNNNALFAIISQKGETIQIKSRGFKPTKWILKSISVSVCVREQWEVLLFRPSFCNMTHGHVKIKTLLLLNFFFLLPPVISPFSYKQVGYVIWPMAIMLTVCYPSFQQCNQITSNVFFFGP